MNRAYRFAIHCMCLHFTTVVFLGAIEVPKFSPLGSLVLLAVIAVAYWPLFDLATGRRP